MDEGMKIDIGCGGAKRDDYVGIDYAPFPGVDHVVDVTAQPLPLPDRSVSHVYSAHFFEHITEPNRILSEIGRVCRDGAHIEIIAPYAFSDEAFVYGHVTYLTELPWIHFCVTHRDEHIEMLGGRWLLKTINFIVPAETERELSDRGFPIDFAIKYLKGVVREFAVEIEFQSELNFPPSTPERTYSNERYGLRTKL